MLTAIFVLLLLFLNKAYKSTLQRLFIYLTIMTVLLEICLTIQIEHFFNYPSQDIFCTILGFFSEYIGSVTYTFTNEISVYLVYIVYSRLKGNTNSISDTGCWTKSLEWIMVSISVIFPLTYTWVPFLDGKYGLNGATCWIKAVDENCTRSGLRDQLVIMSARYMVYAVIVIATIALAIVYCRMAYRHRETESSQIRRLLRQTLLLSTAIIVSITILTLLSLVYVIASFTEKQGNYSLWLANAAGIPFTMLLVPVIFLIYVRNVNVQANLLCGLCRGCTRQREIDTPPWEQTVKSELSHTNPTSTRQSNPSETHFNIDYTGEFTVITMSNAVQKNEGAPLVKNNTSIGYNTVDRSGVI